MIPDVVAVEPKGEYRLRLTFDDGTVGEIDVDALVQFEGVFEKLREPSEFRKVRVDPESGTVVWPNGADLDPLVLYCKVTGTDVDDLLTTESTVDG